MYGSSHPPPIPKVRLNTISTLPPAKKHRPRINNMSTLDNGTEGPTVNCNPEDIHRLIHQSAEGLLSPDLGPQQLLEDTYQRHGVPGGSTQYAAVSSDGALSVQTDADTLMAAGFADQAGQGREQELSIPVSTRTSICLADTKPLPWWSDDYDEPYGNLVTRGDFGEDFKQLPGLSKAGRAGSFTAIDSAVCARACSRLTMEDVLRGTAASDAGNTSAGYGDNSTSPSIAAGTEQRQRYAVSVHPRHAIHALLHGTSADVDHRLADIEDRLAIMSTGDSNAVPRGKRERMSLMSTKRALKQIRQDKVPFGGSSVTFDEPVLLFPRQADGSVASDAEGTWKHATFTVSMTRRSPDALR